MCAEALCLCGFPACRQNRHHARKRTCAKISCRELSGNGSRLQFPRAGKIRLNLRRPLPRVPEGVKRPSGGLLRLAVRLSACSSKSNGFGFSASRVRSPRIAFRALSDCVRARFVVPFRAMKTAPVKSNPKDAIFSDRKSGKESVTVRERDVRIILRKRSAPITPAVIGYDAEDIAEANRIGEALCRQHAR